MDGDGEEQINRRASRRASNSNIAHSIVNTLHAPRQHKEAASHEEMVGALQIRLVKVDAQSLLQMSTLTSNEANEKGTGDSDAIDIGKFVRGHKGHGMDFSNDQFPISHALMRSLLWLILGPPEERSNKCIISHSSVFRVTLDTLISIAAILSVIVAPLELGFDLSRTQP